MSNQHTALIQLLGDDDPDTVAMVKEQLLEIGSDALPKIKALIHVDDVRVARHAKEILDRIESTQADQEFTLLCHLFPEDGDLENASWLLARALIPGIETDEAAHQLDVWGRELGEILHGVENATAVVRNMARYISGDLGFRGNADDYYNPRNSLLPAVIGSRLGIPVTMTLLYILLGKRVGKPVVGINLPGHFIARYDDVFFDPFNEGMQLSATDCEAILAKQDLAMQAHFLDSANPRQILHRMLVNLAHIYNQQEINAQRLQIGAWLKALSR